MGTGSSSLNNLDKSVNPHCKINENRTSINKKGDPAKLYRCRWHALFKKVFTWRIRENISFADGGSRLLLGHVLLTVTLCLPSQNVRLYFDKIVTLCPPPQNVRFSVICCPPILNLFFFNLHIMFTATKCQTISRIKISAYYVHRHEISDFS